jgi:PAS domain S-box-containing protein
MTVARTKTIALLAIPILAIGEFLVGLIAPLGITDWVWFVIPLLFSLYVGGRFLPYVLAAVLSTLLLVGFFFAPPGIDPGWALISRLVGILVLWLMALMISHRKQTVAEIHKLSRAVEHSPASIVITDKAGNIEYVNPKFTQVTGYSFKEAIGKNPRILKSGEMPPENYQRMWETINGGGEWRGEFHNRKKNGELYWESASISPIADATGEITHFLAVKEDITQRKGADMKLAESRNYLDKIINTAAEPIFVKDRQHRWVLVNDACCHFFGHKREELLGKSDCDFFPKSEADVFWLKDEEVFNTGKENINEENFTAANGDLRTLITKKTLYTDEKGEQFIVGIISDITARKQVEEALQLSKQRLSLHVEQTPLAAIQWDSDFNVQEWNPAAEKVFGYTREEAVGRHYSFIVPEPARARVDVVVRALLGQRGGNRSTNENITKNDKIITCEWFNTTLVDSAGKTIGVASLIQDITERQRGERQLAETLDFNQKIISDAAAGIVVFKASGQCLLANEAAARTINATVPQLLEQNFRQLESWRISGMLKIAEEALATGKPQQCEPHFVSTFGKEAWLVCHFTPFVRGDEPHLLMLFNDITGRKQAEEHVREQAALLDKAQDAIFVLDSGDRIIYWNKSAERIYGWTAAEAIGKSAIELLFQGVVTPQLAKTIKTVNERGEWVGEMQEYTKDGKLVTVQGRGNLIRDEQGRPKSRLIINTDITERKSLEMQFLRSQRMEGIGALAGGIAHDLNNVLTPLLVSVQVLKEKITDEDGQKLLQALEVNVQRGAGLVKQVLAFGRGVTGERIAINPKHITREIKQIIHETFPKSVEFELYSAADLWTITGDPTQLHQVLLNLCVNARDAMPKGGKLSIHMENLTFDETYVGMNPEATVGPYVCIKVTDTGMGIPREIQDRIFDPFFTTKEPGKGTGLGLSTTLAIVKSHGGFIHCHSAPGKGSRFEIYFPANNTAVTVANAAVEESSLMHGHNELVLVVDDEEPILKIAQKTLEHFGYRVLLAADGAEAVSLYEPRQKEIDVVITDIVMPIMDGPAMIVALKTINPDVKIVSSSGLASDGGLAKARDAGVLCFIPKPYTAETMLHALHEVLNGN